MHLPFADRLGGTGDQRDLARKVGRPYCGFSRSAGHRLGGSGSYAREGLRLLLNRSPRHGNNLIGTQESSRSKSCFDDGGGLCFLTAGRLMGALTFELQPTTQNVLSSSA